MSIFHSGSERAQSAEHLEASEAPFVADYTRKIDASVGSIYRELMKYRTMQSLSGLVVSQPSIEVEQPQQTHVQSDYRLAGY